MMPHHAKWTPMKGLAGMPDIASLLFQKPDR
jgi:hypothetical protein